MPLAPNRFKLFHMSQWRKEDAKVKKTLFAFSRAGLTRSTTRAFLAGYVAT